MGERKVLNKYYPPDFDPSQIRRQKKPKNHRMKVRMMLPITTRCSTCGNFIYHGTKFNSFNETVMEETYLGIPMFRFYFKCSHCCAEIILKTDPKESDYTVEAGATRNFEPWRVHDEEVKKRDAEEMGDAIKALESKTFDSKWDMDSMAALGELKSMKSRRATISQGAMLDVLQGMGADKVKKLNEEDEALIESIFHGPKQHVRRIDDEEWDDGNGVIENDFVKKRKFSVDARKPTDLLTKGILTNDSSSKGPSDDKFLTVWPPAFKVRSKRKPAQDPDNEELAEQETRSKQQGKSKSVTRIALQSLCQYDCEDE